MCVCVTGSTVYTCYVKRAKQARRKVCCFATKHKVNNQYGRQIQHKGHLNSINYCNQNLNLTKKKFVRTKNSKDQKSAIRCCCQSLCRFTTMTKMANSSLSYTLDFSLYIRVHTLIIISNQFFSQNMSENERVDQFW